MHQELRQQIREATSESDDKKLDFGALVKIIDHHYDKMQATLSESLALTLTSSSPIEAIFDSVTDALLSVSESGTIRNCNKGCERFFGIAKEQLMGTPVSLLLPQAKDQPVAGFLAPFMANLDDTQINAKCGEIAAVHANGGRVVAEINASRIDAAGSKIFVINLRDISARKDAERTLRENEERYRALVENAPEAIVVLDVDSNRFVDANENACQLFKLSRTRLLSVGPQAISPRMQPDGSASFGVRRGHVSRALNGELPHFEWLHQDAFGSEIPTEVRFSRLPDGERKLIRVSITNIAERKRQEAFSFAENKILEMIASGKPYDRTLRSICRATEKIGNDMQAAVMLLNVKQQRLSVEQAPSLPDEMKLLLDFTRVNEVSLTCGEAVFCNREKFVEDILQNDGWAAHAKKAKTSLAGWCWISPSA